MDRNQFFYKRITYTAPKEEGGEKVEHIWNDSFNITKVIRSMEFEKETIVLLDDGHEVAEEVPVKNKKGGVDYVRQRIWSVSEIHLTDKDDIDQFKKVTSVYRQGDMGGLDRSMVKEVYPEMVKESIV